MLGSPVWGKLKTMTSKASRHRNDVASTSVRHWRPDALSFLKWCSQRGGSLELAMLKRLRLPMASAAAAKLKSPSPSSKTCEIGGGEVHWTLLERSKPAIHDGFCRYELTNTWTTSNPCKSHGPWISKSSWGTLKKNEREKPRATEPSGWPWKEVVTEPLLDLVSDGKIFHLSSIGPRCTWQCL